MKRIIFRFIIISLVFVSICVAIISTTGFEIQKNPMEHFFSQHEQIDSLQWNKTIPKALIHEDIDFMIKTIEEVHPNPFSYISRNNFYKKADSIKQTITDDITRLELQQTLSYFINSINDGHTQIKFPELSDEEDNKSNFDQAHSDIKKINTYKILEESIGYLKVKDFVIDKRDFYNNVDSIFAKIHNDSIGNLIIDIRNNPGGNSELADYLISCIYSKPYKGNSKILIKRSEQYYKYMRGYFSWWFKPFLTFIKQINDYKHTPVGMVYEDIKGFKNPINIKYRFKGKIYLLINSNTFSTALGFATVIKDYEIGHIIGEQTKSEVNEFGDIYPFDLPNSGLWVWTSAKRYIRPSGELTIGGLKPDTFVEDVNDNILEYTIRMIKSEY
ncbi:MAG: S41 family peptidase [Bacteroidota bacterium]